MKPMSNPGPAEPSSPSAGSARHLLVVVGAACLMIAGMFVFLGSSILNPPLARSLGVGLSQVMVYNSLMSVSGVLAMSFIAPLAFRRLGVRAAVIGLGLWTAAMLAAVVFVTGPVMLYMLGLATGLTSGVVTSMAASMLVNTWFQERRGTVMGAVFAASGLGGITAGLILPALVNLGGWKLGFAVNAGVFLLLVVAPGIFLIRSSPAELGLRPYGASQATDEEGSEHVDLPGIPAGVAFRTPQFATLALGLMLIASVIAVQQHFAPLMVERGVSLTVAGALISLMALASVFTNILVGTLNDRRGTRTAIMVALLGQMLAMIGYAFSYGFVPLALSTILFAIGGALPGVLIPIVVMQVFGVRDYATILGPVMAMMPAGVSLGTPLWGVSFDLSGSYTTALGVAAVLTAVGAALVWWTLTTAPGLRRRFEQASPEP